MSESVFPFAWPIVAKTGVASQKSGEVQVFANKYSNSKSVVVVL